MFLPVIMSGGAGERLWPVSRESSPKPFVVLGDGQSLLQKAFLRALSQDDVNEVVTVTNCEHYFKTRSNYAAINKERVPTSYILEPVGRNTAPAMAMAAHYAAAMYGEDAIMLVLSADQLIENEEAFHSAVLEARLLAAQDYLVTFGIQPNRPETGYGYIKRQPELLGGTSHGYRVEAFVEKPDQATAETYLSGGAHFWNAGIFCFKAKTFLAELQLHCPEVAGAVIKAIPTDWSKALNDYVELAPASFGAIPKISVDYAVMEKSSRVAVVACDIGWNDVGSWSAMGEMIPADANNNRIVGDVYTHASSGCFIQGSDRIVAAVGVQDLIIVDTPDALLVANRDSVQQVKHIVSQLKQDGHAASREHCTVARPWGSYTVLQESPGFKIKRIEVQPGQKLSLQKHQHRSEHWVVVSGIARIQNGEEVSELHPSQSTYIPAGHKHRLENCGTELLVMVEVQCGAYLGEDDITRFDDHYGRCAVSAVA